MSYWMFYLLMSAIYSASLLSSKYKIGFAILFSVAAIASAVAGR